MSLPIYKKLDIPPEGEEKVTFTLDKCDFNKRPYLLCFKNYTSKLLKKLDLYFSNKKPLYPIYITFEQKVSAGDQLSLSQIRVIDNKDQLPKFFLKRQKQLNLKENTLLNKIRLKQAQSLNIDYTETQEVIREYSENHKEIKETYSFIAYLKLLSQKIDQKR